MKIKKIMSTNVVTVKETDSLFTAIKKMHQHNIGFMIVTNNEERVCGVFTDRDALMALISNITLEDSVKRVMRKDVITAKSSMSTADACELLGYYQVKRLVVLDDFDKLEGVVSLSDLANDPQSEEYALEALCEISAGFDTIDPWPPVLDNSLNDEDFEDY